MWYVSLFGLLALMFLFTRNRNRKKKPIAAPTKPDMLHGHDLNKWIYLGFVELSLNEDKYPVFLFADRQDHSRRSYTITGANPDWCRKYHSYVTKYLEPWTKGEFNVYTLCKDPSRWLQEYMLEHYSCEWDAKTVWWKSSDASKYKSAQTKQNKDKSPPNQGSGAQKDPVVIQVEFGKKHED